MSTAERTLPTPVYAVFGAGDVVVQEAKDVYDRLRDRAENAQTRLSETRTRLAELPSEVDVEELKAKLTVDEIKTKLSKEELRKVTAPCDRLLQQPRRARRGCGGAAAHPDRGAGQPGPRGQGVQRRR